MGLGWTFVFFLCVLLGCLSQEIVKKTIKLAGLLTHPADRSHDLGLPKVVEQMMLQKYSYQMVGEIHGDFHPMVSNP